MKHTAPLYLDLPLKPAFCCVFLLFLEREAFASFRLIYFWSNPSVKGDEGDIFSKTPDWKLLLFLKIKIKQSLDCPSKQFNAIFKYINKKNISAYPRSKKNLNWSKIQNFLAYCKEIRTKRGVVKQIRFIPNTVGGSRREHNHSKQNLYNK